MITIVKQNSDFIIRGIELKDSTGSVANLDDVKSAIIKISTKESGNLKYILFTKADIKEDNSLYINKKDLLTLKEGQLYAQYILTIDNPNFEDDGTYDTEYKEMLNYYLEGADNLDDTNTSDIVEKVMSMDVDIANIKTDYATKVYVDQKVGEIDLSDFDMSPYATKEQVETLAQDIEDKGYLTEHQSLADYYNKTDVDGKVEALTENINGKADVNHTHEQYATQEAMDASFGKVYSKYEINTRLNAKADLEHTHEQYITVEALEGKADKIHTHEQYLTEHQSLANYYNKSEINGIVDNINTMSVEIVDELPTENIKTSAFYLKPTTDGKDENSYDEYLYVSGNWELVGNTSVDLTDYYTKSESDAKMKSTVDGTFWGPVFNIEETTQQLRCFNMNYEFLKQLRTTPEQKQRNRAVNAMTLKAYVKGYVAEQLANFKTETVQTLADTGDENTVYFTPTAKPMLMSLDEDEPTPQSDDTETFNAFVYDTNDGWVMVGENLENDGKEYYTKTEINTKVDDVKNDITNVETGVSNIDTRLTTVEETLNGLNDLLGTI